MDYSQIIEWITANAPAVVQWVLMGLGALVVAAQSYVLATPGTDDDNWLAGIEAKPIIGDILRFFKAFSPIQRKSGDSK